MYFLSWSGFLVSFMMRNDINIAIVAMVRSAPPVLNETNQTEFNSTNTTNISGEYDWSSMVKSLILGSFYCCYVLSQVHFIDLSMTFYLHQTLFQLFSFIRLLAVLQHNILVQKIFLVGRNLQRPFVVYAFHWLHRITTQLLYFCVQYKVLHLV